MTREQLVDYALNAAFANRMGNGIAAIGLLNEVQDRAPDMVKLMCLLAGAFTEFPKEALVQLLEAK